MLMVVAGDTYGWHQAVEDDEDAAEHRTQRGRGPLSAVRKSYSRIPAVLMWRKSDLDSC